MASRRYEKKKRKVQEAETRQRIVAATSELHEEVGPARTTVTAIAERAGVARPTVYQHFPDERELFGACAAHFSERHPPPDSGEWQKVKDPHERLRKALAETYEYYASTERMTANVVRDAALLPALGEVLEKDEGPYFEEVSRVLATGWGVRGQRRQRLMAVLGLALDFGTWQRLVSEGGLSAEQAAETMAGTVALAADRSPSQGTE